MIIQEYKSLMDYFITSMEKERILSNPVMDEKKFIDYLQALKLVTEVFPADKGKIIADNPETPYSSHCISVDIYDTDFEDERLAKFAKILSLMDGMSFFGKNQLNVILQMEIYVEGV